MNQRGAGLLMHISSLPSVFGIGDLGPASYRFVDFLADAGMQYWQILPLNPTAVQYDNSPYHCLSAFGTNPLFISPEKMAEAGYLDPDEITNPPPLSTEQVDFPAVCRYKEDLFTQAFERWKPGEDPEFARFCRENAWWLDDFALFFAITKEYSGIPWYEWPEDLKIRDSDRLESITRELKDAIQKEKFLQFLFAEQWRSLKRYCASKNVKIIGDLPIYVDYDSVDVWVNPRLFYLDNYLRPITVSGVPPDYFSSTGQLWENPTYNWENMKQTGYSWWIHRFERNLCLVDLLRIDHFRGLVAYWEVPAGEKTAINGKWTRVPTEEFLEKVMEKIPPASLIAEDLGVITPDVTEIMEKYRFPGMRVLEFAFIEDTATNPHAPHRHVRDCIVYTGTHDNNPLAGWFKELDPESRDRLFSYLGYEPEEGEIPRILIRMAMASVADLVVIPMQDILGLDSGSRMNIPGINTGNWRWRLSKQDLTREISDLKEMVRIYGRGE